VAARVSRTPSYIAGFVTIGARQGRPPPSLMQFVPPPTMGGMAQPHVKICGVTSVEDAQLAVAEGAWAVGMIFYEGSPRACDPAVAAEICAVLKRQAETVGVFVNRPLDEVAGLADGIGFTALQLHGDEGPTYCDEVYRRTGAKIIKAARVGAKADIQAIDAFRRVDFHLLDTRVEGVPGGTGETFDWSLTRERRSRVPLILSGGLTPDNVGGAIEAVRPWGVDVASGVEAEPGVKDPEKLRAFFAAARPVPEAVPSAEPATS
jgi:phosphoribosylanthranilate isomerase